MEITKEAIQARKQKLLEQVQQLDANRNATLGALQDCEYWLAQLSTPQLKQN